MYLARFTLDDQQWMQAAVSFSDPVRLSDAIRRRYDAVHREVLDSLIHDRELRFGFRVVLEGGRILRTVFLSAPVASEVRFRRSIASFTRLNLLVEDSVSFPSGREDHDRVIAAFPPRRASLTVPRYGASRGVWLSCDFFLSRALDHVIGAAAGLGYEVGFQCNVEPI